MSEKDYIDGMLGFNTLIWTVYALNIEDGEAFEFLNDEAFALQSFEFEEDLIDAFDWQETPQGFAFWADVYEQLIDAGYTTQPLELINDEDFQYGY